MISHVSLDGALKLRAGKTFKVPAVQLELNTGETVDPDTVTCTLKTGEKRVAQLAVPCSWRIPKKARGKSTILELDLGYEGAETTVRYTMKVRG